MIGSPDDGAVEVNDLGSEVVLREFVPHPYQSLNEAGEILTVNDAWLDLLGYERSDVEGEWFGTFLTASSTDLFESRFPAFKDEGSVSGVEFEIVRADGWTVAVSFDGVIQYDDDGDVVRTHCQFSDITERKQYEQKLEHRTAELEALNRLVRHDIRNDMAIVLGRAELLEEYVHPEGSDHLREIQESSEHAVELTKIVRDFVKTLNSDDKTDIEPTSVRLVLTTELEHARDSYPDTEFVTASEIPDVEVRANELLGSVFRNILNNAVQHNDNETPVVEVDCDAGPDDVEVRIADNGPGIPDDRKQSIFGKGEKGLASSGTGIGLYLVQRLIDQYDGRVRVEDNDPDGAVFVLELPRYR